MPLDIRLASDPGVPDVLALPVRPVDGGGGAEVVPVGAGLAGASLIDELADLLPAYLADAEHTGAPGKTHTLPRPLERPHQILLGGTGTGDPAGWRAFGAGIARAARRAAAVTVAVPAGTSPDAVRALVEGLHLAAYQYRLGAVDPAKAPRLRRVALAVDDPGAYADAVARAGVTAEVTMLARDWVNTPSDTKDPAWLAGQMAAAARDRGMTARVLDAAELVAEGFGGIVAVGGGSSRPPRLVELRWAPPGASAHVVLVGKGITFDTGGIALKPRDAMKLMRKDMGGAAAVAAAGLGAAALALPVAVTVLAPLAENMASGTAYRPGDVVRHYGGRTTEVLDTDAEGRLVLADALAYAVQRLEPDLLVDLATLTGAQGVALGKRTAAMYADGDHLADALAAAAAAAGEQVWRMPLVDDYVELFDSGIADGANVAWRAGGGSITAALFLREFTGPLADRWAHIDMSAPAWAETNERELVKGATGWGVRTLLRWLESIPG